jgi:hypothetical protein
VGGSPGWSLRPSVVSVSFHSTPPLKTGDFHRIPELDPCQLHESICNSEFLVQRNLNHKHNPLGFPF